MSLSTWHWWSHCAGKKNPQLAPLLAMRQAALPCTYHAFHPTEDILIKERRKGPAGQPHGLLWEQINQLHHYIWHDTSLFASTKLALKWKWKMGYKWKCGWIVGVQQLAGGGRLHKTSAVWASSERETSTRLLCVSTEPSCFFSFLLSSFFLFNNKTTSPTTYFGLLCCPLGCK